MRPVTRLLAVCALLWPCLALAQSVPNPESPLNTGPGCSAQNPSGCTVWTPQQWIHAFQTKQDYNGDSSGQNVTSNSVTNSLATWMLLLQTLSPENVTASGGLTMTLANWMQLVANFNTPASGPILGTWPNLYFAPSPAFTGLPTVTGGITAQMEFIRPEQAGAGYSFFGVSSTAIGISSAENLPITFANNAFTTRVYIDPAFGNVGIGTVTPGARLDVAAQSIIVEQAFTPSSSSQACTTGQISWDTGFVYVCVTTNTWKRATLGTF